MNKLENDTITLRAPEPEDLEILYKWENDTSLWQVGITIAPFSRHILKKYIETAHLDIFETKQLRFMIGTRSGETIGAIDLFDFDPLNRRAGIGVLIAAEEQRRKGYASSALTLLISYCFGILALHQVYCSIDSSNTSSIVLFEKHGFVRCGVRKDWNLRNNSWEDEILYQLINADRS